MILIRFILRKSAFFNKMQQIQVASKVKKKETEKKQNSCKKTKFCITSTGPLTRLWKWEKSFLDVVGIYLKENQSLAPLPPSFLCQWLFSITNILILRSTRRKSYNCYYDFCTLQKKYKMGHYERCIFKAAIFENLFFFFVFNDI